MPRYYFDMMDDDGLLVDDEGVELSDLDAAQEEAARSLGDMVRDATRNFKRGPIQQMGIEVRDEIGRVMHVRFSVEVQRRN